MNAMANPMTLNDGFRCCLLVLVLAGCGGTGIVDEEMVDPALAAHLQAINEMVDRWIDNQEVVGTEYVIIQKGEIVLHEARGWRDREAERPMELNTIFQVRSMTKPVLATGVLLLVSEGLLDLEDRVSQHLLSFSSSPVTIRQLLTRTDGFTRTPFNAFNFPSLRDAVNELGRLGPDVQPGTVFSRDGTDSWTLGAIVQEVSEMKVEDFLQQRVLSAVGMTGDTYVELKENDTWRSRLSAVYQRSESGDFLLTWSTQRASPFKFFPASAGIYTTPLEYAKFLALWMNEGRIGSTQFIPQTLVDEALILEPLSIEQATPFGTTPYGMHWDLGPGVLQQGTGIASFGHPGADGTIGWVVPERELLILYFTQSRGGSTHFQFVEEVIRRLAQ